MGLGRPASKGLLVGVMALGLLGLPAAADASGTQNYTCVPNPNSAAPFWAGSSAAQSFPANSSGKLLTVDVKNVYRATSATDADIAVEVYGADGSGNLVAPLLASATIPGNTVTDDDLGHHYTVNFAAASAAFLTEGELYGIALRTTDSVSNLWGFRDGNTCTEGTLLGGGPPYGPLFDGTWDAGLTTYLGPANDDFARAQTLAGASPSIGATTKGASREIGEPDHYTIGPPGDPELWDGAHSVWYRWEALGSGPATIDACGGNIDSILAVYTGSDLGTLQRVTDNNNGAACVTPGDEYGSFVSFTAVAGTTYDIAVGDAGGAFEDGFSMFVSGPANEAPTITNPRPDPHSLIRDETPKIKATVADSATDLEAEDIQFGLDGKLRHGFTYDQATDRLKFQARRLDPGKHQVEIGATDEQALLVGVGWRFRIRR